MSRRHKEPSPLPSPQGAPRRMKAALQDVRGALAEPDPIVRDVFLAGALQGCDEANPPITTTNDAQEAGAQVQTYYRDGERHLRLVDTHDDPRLVNVAAQHRRLELADDARAVDIALDLKQSLGAANAIERCLADQMAAAHVQAMKLAARSERYLERAETVAIGHGQPDRAQIYGIEGVRLANASARLMAAFQAGAETLAKLRTGGQQRVVVTHQHIQVAGGNVAVAGHVETKEG